MPMFEPGECPANIPLGKNHYSKVPNECRMGTVDFAKRAVGCRGSRFLMFPSSASARAAAFAISANNGDACTSADGYGNSAATPQ